MVKENTDCATCVNHTCLIKKHVNDENVSKFIDRKITVKCKKSQQFILEGAPMHGLYFIYNGKIKVTKTGIYGREQIVRFAKPGAIIGHRGISKDNRYPIGAVAIEDSTLCSFSNETLAEMLKTLPELTYDLMLFYSSELNVSETKVKTLAQMTVREKVIDVFLYLFRKFGQTKEGYLDIALSRKEIADFAGTTEEQVIRVISSLKKEKLLQTSGKKIGITSDYLLKKEIADHNFFLDN